jgi:hypothetical protein
MLVSRWPLAWQSPNHCTMATGPVLTGGISGGLCGIHKSKARAPVAVRNAAIRAAAISKRARLLESGRDIVGRLRYLEQPLT